MKLWNAITEHYIPTWGSVPTKKGRHGRTVIFVDGEFVTVIVHRLWLHMRIAGRWYRVQRIWDKEFVEYRQFQTVRGRRKSNG